jgi:hypothetical protein
MREKRLMVKRKETKTKRERNSFVIPDFFASEIGEREKETFCKGGNGLSNVKDRAMVES